MKRPRFNALCCWPTMGSLWLEDVHLSDGFVVGKVWEEEGYYSYNMPDDYHGQYHVMNFPLSCVRKLERSIQ